MSAQWVPKMCAAWCAAPENLAFIPQAKRALSWLQAATYHANNGYDYGDHIGSAAITRRRGRRRHGDAAVEHNCMSARVQSDPLSSYLSLHALTSWPVMADLCCPTPCGGAKQLPPASPQSQSPAMRAPVPSTSLSWMPRSRPWKLPLVTDWLKDVTTPAGLGGVRWGGVGWFHVCVWVHLMCKGVQHPTHQRPLPAHSAYLPAQPRGRIPCW